MAVVTQPEFRQEVAGTARERIADRQRRLGTHLCVGLDPDPERIPAGLTLADFCLAIMEATAPHVCAFKPNAAFFEARGIAGWVALEQVIGHARHLGVPVILDAKRGDIGSSARFYAEAAFGRLGADALTVNPYLGADAVTPFLEYNKNALSYVLCATSNPAGVEFQGTAGTGSGEAVFLKVARMVEALHRTHGNVGLVVGATRPDVMTAVREAAPDVPWLVPGIGQQGGDLAAVARLAPPDVVFNASRSVLYAATGAGFEAGAAEAARQAKEAFNDAR